MKLDRNMKAAGGWGKYALINMREMNAILRKPRTRSRSKDAVKQRAVVEAFETLLSAGIIKSGAERKGAGFFVMRYADKFTPKGLLGYHAAISEEIRRIPPGPLRNELIEFAREIHGEFCISCESATQIPT